MNVKEISDGIFYVGVNDRTTGRFEAMWPLPYGVSYNSYLVMGEKCALIDSVEIECCGALIDHLKEAHDGHPIDYLVINHMEPDHSGSIPVLLNRYPGMRLGCNSISKQQIKGFYHIEDDERFVVVADGDTLDLGGKTLRFFTTPMVHWPETMMTWCEEAGVLFTGDAFGCYGALNGFVTDDEMTDDERRLYLEEMYRYYSNIVAKYAKFVQRAIAKVGSLPFKYICSTHGPVWHEMIPDVVAVYDRLSRWEGEDGAVIVFGTMYGHTSELVDEICKALRRNGIHRISVMNANKEELSYIISDCVRYKTVIIGSPTYSMDIFPPVAALVRALAVRETQNKVVGTFGSFTWANGSLPKLNEAFEGMKLAPVAQLAMKQAYSPADDKQIEEFAKAIAEASK